MIDQKKLKDSFDKIKEDIFNLSQEIIIIKDEIEKIKQNMQANRTPTPAKTPTHTPTDNLPNYALIQPNFHSSIGNEGVPTDSQQTVNRQTNTLKRTYGSIETAELVSTISHLKQNLKEKFKTLTKQEFLIFSILYALEEQLKIVTYKDISERACLAESSVRDCISRLQRKGLPIAKEKINNKVVILKIPRELKEITVLQP